MTLFQAVILGLVEGITEYLPVSSTGHLIIAATLLGLADTPEAKAAADDFEIVIQGGAIAAVAGLYWKRLVQMLRGLAGGDAEGRRLLVNLIVAFLPAAVIGPLLKDPIQARLFHPWPVIAALAAGGVLMIALGRWEPKSPIELDALTWRLALLIGLAQCVAMWPGTSRSMVTIVAGMVVGLRPRHAAEFSFLLGLPTLGGACVYSGRELIGEPGAIDDLGGPLPIIVAFLVATVSAAIAVRWLVEYLGRHGVAAFGWYRLALCAVLVTLALTGVVEIGAGP